MSALMETLAASELFRGIGAEDLAALGALASTSALASATSLFRLGDQAENLYVVLRGRVALALPMEIRGGQQDVTVDEKGPGDVVGWSALVPPHRSTLSARALIDSEVLSFPAAALAAALRERPAVGLQVMTNLAAVVGRRMHQTQAMWLRELQRMVSTRYA